MTLGLSGDFLTGLIRLRFRWRSSGRSRRSKSHIACRLVNSLGSTFLDPVARVFSVRSSHTLRFCLRNRGLLGTGSSDWWVSGMVDSRQGVLRSA